MIGYEVLKALPKINCHLNPNKADTLERA